MIDTMQIILPHQTDTGLCFLMFIFYKNDQVMHKALLFLAQTVNTREATCSSSKNNYEQSPSKCPQTGKPKIWHFDPRYFGVRPAL